MEESTPKNRTRYSLRVLRPLFWWFILVLALYAIRTHQRLMEKTRLDFNFTLQGQAIDATASLDGKPAFSGQQISLGSHIFTVSYPKTVSFSTNLFIWYGGRNLGDIALKRSMGTLAITANPAAGLIDIRGPEFSLKLTNSAGLSTNVPTDHYKVEARYAHSQQSGNVTVYPMIPGTWNFAPRLGVLEMVCNQTNAAFQLFNKDGEAVETGEFPAMIRDLPEGAYTLQARHGSNGRKEWITVKEGTTNTVEVKFSYGAALLETDPLGATVRDAAGRYLGTTPASLSELPVGKRGFELRRDGYEPLSVTLGIASGETNNFRTNLVSLDYGRTMNAARQYLTAGDYDRASTSVGEALRAKPDDITASELNKTVASALEKQRQEMIAAIRKEDRLNRPKTVMESVSKKYLDAGLFESHTLSSRKPIKEIGQSINTAVLNPPFLETVSYDWPDAETFTIEGRQKVPGGYRQLLIVGAQTRDDEAQVVFKVLEYETHLNVNIGGILRVTDGKSPIVAVHPGRIEMTAARLDRMREGGQIVTERIEKVIGQ